MGMNDLPRGITASDREIHVWRIALVEPDEVVGDLRTILSDDELRRADRFRAEGHRSRFVVGRATMRRVLGAYLAEDPRCLSFATNTHGKPRLEGSRLEFNLSHSADRAILAVSRDRRVGIDIEQVRPMQEGERIAARFFSASECETFLKLPDTRKNEAFFHIWTRKEAYIKAIGVGISIPLDSFDVPAQVDPLHEPFAMAARGNDPTPWTMRDIATEPGYVAALVVEGGAWEWRGFDASADLRARP
ncbi:MAG: phosphopantetheine-protein transferase [Planctomycetota bacterium]|nr:phosphopantetheine-protein transferase [Planctomycetota bacterium]